MNCPNLSPKLLVWCWLVASAGNVCAQPLELKWSQRLLGAESDAISYVIERRESGFEFCYRTSSFGVGDDQVRLVQMDSLGNIAIDRIFGGRHNEMANDIVETSDGGTLVSASTGSYGPDSIFWSAWFIKTDENADSMWSTVLSRVGSSRIGLSAVETDGGYIALTRNLYGGFRQGISVFFLDSSGEVVNEHQLEICAEADTTFNVRYGHLMRLQDGNILVVADAIGDCLFCEFEYSHFEHIWMWCLNSQLDSLWTQHYRFAADTFLESTPRAVQAANGDIFVTSAIHAAETDYLNTNAAIWRLNSQGDLIWSRVFGNEWESYSYSLANSPDGGVVLAGGLSVDSNETSQNWLFKVGTNGDSLWSVRVGDAEVYRYQDIAATSDGGYVLATTRNDWVGYWALDIELYRFGPEDISPVDGRPIGVPQKITLNAFPNPFNAVTTLSVELPQAGNTTLNVYDVQGRLVRTLVNDYLLPGSHRFSFNGSDIGSGTYFVRLDANKTQNVKKMVLVK